MTVNITCNTCDGRNLCDACRTAARTLAAAGHRVEHSSRYAALRAAAAGAYGFDACVVPVTPDERSILDAAVSLLGDRRLAIVADASALGRSPGVTVLAPAAFASGSFALDWLAKTPLLDRTAQDAEPATVAMPRIASDTVDERRRATQRLKRVADASRAAIATADLPVTPRLDLLAVLDDEIAWAKASDGVFAICLVHLPGLSSIRAGESPGDAEPRIAEAAGVIATAVRSSDVISGRGDDFVVVLVDADAAGAKLASERIGVLIGASTLRPRAKGKTRARGFAAWGVGQASYPGDGTTRESLLARATATLKPI